MRPLDLIFMGTPAFALPTLAAMVASGHRVVAVYTAPARPAGRGQKETPSAVHQYALENHLPVYTPATLKEQATQQQFAAHKADAAIVAAYGLLLPEPILKAPRMGCLNVHPSLLPRWRGAAPIQRTIMAGDKETGVVIMQMDKGLDTGDMLMVEPYDIPDGLNAGHLQDELAKMAGPMVLLTLEGLEQGTIIPVKQAQTGATYAPKITKEECRIDWREPAVSIRNKVLGLSPNPGAYFIYRGEAIKVLDADIYPHKVLKEFSAAAVPGTVMDNVLTTACGQGALAPGMVQRPGKKPMPVLEMLKGYPIPAGTVLE